MQTQEKIRLTQQVRAGGCASKLPPGSLRKVLETLPKQTDANVLVGFDTSDDAGIYRLNDHMALVQTIDFFTPMVDDPYTYGRIAATNALSDVYAMGGRPVSSLAVVCFPENGDLETLASIMAGGLSVMQEAGCSVIGGHSVKDAEIKFGYAVTGLIDPSRVFANVGARPGDVLLLTKPIGTGVITTALKQGKAEDLWVENAIRSMTTPNRKAAEVLAGGNFDVHAMTDVTGFGLMGHGREMAMGSDVVLEIDTAAVPLIEGALEAVRRGAIPRGLVANREFAECVVSDAPGSSVPDEIRALLFDPQTSGGLLIAVGAKDAERLAAALVARGCGGAIVGRVLDPAESGVPKGHIQIR
ncbi:MAG TPA: selenide, water dikinase SelD [Bryobacteraceae bacterium]|nr:selenide, water dikinase SelD [Bryobacteraceae bacterium]